MKEFEKEIKSQILELDNIPLTVTDRNQKTKEFREILKQKRKEVTAVFFADQNRLKQLFEQDAEEEFEFSHLPAQVKQNIHGLAWELGHAYGHSEVLNHYDGLVEIALSAYNAGKSAKLKKGGRIMPMPYTL
jgi:predicted oxidoreductase (fatty acid repression mutant protein)